MKEKNLFVDRYYIFEFDRQTLIAILNETKNFYTHIVDCNMTIIQIKNDLSISIKISQRVRLELFIKYKKKNAIK